MPTLVYTTNPNSPGIVNAQIQSTLDGSNLVTGYRQDLATSQTVGLSLTNSIGITSYRWELIGRPEGSVAGGAGPEPIALGAAPTASFTVDDDSGAFPRDGGYIVQCVVNARTPTETRLRALLVRLNPNLTIDGRTLRLLAANEANEDTSNASIAQGYATMGNRLLREAIGAARGVEGFRQGNPTAEGAWTGPSPDNVYWPGQQMADPNDFTVQTPAADTLYAIPLFFGSSGTVKDLIIRQRAGTTGLGRLGLYTNLAKGTYPETLLGQGAVSFTAAAAYEVALDLRVGAGLYWLVAVFDSDVVANGVTVDHYAAEKMQPIVGTASDLIDGGGAGLDFAVGWSHAFPYAALPAAFPTGAPVQLQPGGAGLPVPGAFFRWGL